VLTDAKEAGSEEESKGSINGAGKGKQNKSGKENSSQGKLTSAKAET